MLLDNPHLIPPINNATISATAFGLTVTTKDGKPATLAIVDEEGNTLEAGNHVAQAAWHLMIAARNNFLIGQGHLRVLV